MIDPREQARRCGVLPRGEELNAEGSETDVGLFIYEESGTDPDGTAMDPGDISIRANKRINNVGLADTDPDADTEPPNEDQAVLTWSNFSVSSTEVIPDEGIDVSADVENTASEPAILTARVLADGEAITSRPLTIDGGTTDTVAFEVFFDAEGVYEVGINRTDTRTVFVNNANGL